MKKLSVEFRKLEYGPLCVPASLPTNKAEAPVKMTATRQKQSNLKGFLRNLKNAIFLKEWENYFVWKKIIIIIIKQRKAIPLIKSRNHCLAQLFLWVFLVNTFTCPTMEPKRTEAVPVAWNTWAHEQCPVVTEKKCQLPNYFQKLWQVQSLLQLCLH